MGSNSKATPKKSAKNKRHVVGIGDLVMFHTMETHMFGTLGKVIAVVNDDLVVVKCLSPGNRSFSEAGMTVSLFTYEPKGTTKDGDNKSYFSNYITEIVHRVDPKPVKPKKPKVVKPPRVIQTPDELIEHLAAGDHKERIIIAPTATELTA